jgi:hypothetical protein
MECKSLKTRPSAAIMILTCPRVVLMNYREDGVTPYVTVWKHGLSAMKV